MRPRLHILLVHYQPSERGVTKLMLETRGPYRVTTAENAQQAIAALSNRKFRLVIVHLLGTKGNVLVERLKELWRETPMILASDSIRSGECAHSADAFWGKGSTPLDLITSVNLLSLGKTGPKKGAVSARRQKVIDRYRGMVG